MTQNTPPVITPGSQPPQPAKKQKKQKKVSRKTQGKPR